MKRICLIIFALTSLLISACGQSQSVIETAVAMTVTAMTSNTPVYTVTPVPTDTPTKTPTPLTTNTPRPTATNQVPTLTPQPLMGSYEFPYSFDYPGSIAQDTDKEFTIQISQVLRGDEAFQKLYAENTFNKTAPPGMDWICIMVHAEYTQGPSGQTLDFDKFVFKTVSKGSILDIPFYVPFAPDFKVSILPKGMGEGWLCGYVYTDDTKPLVVFGHSDTNPGYYFSLTP